MATNFIDMSKKHAVCESSKLLATNGGKHIYNIKISQDMDNGMIVAKDALVSGEQEVYSMKASTGFAGKIIGQAGNGNYLVEVVTPGDALLLLQVPLIYEEYTTLMQAEFNFYNKNGDIVRAYELATGDIFALSAEGIDGEIAVGADVNVTSYKVTVDGE